MTFYQKEYYIALSYFFSTNIQEKVSYTFVNSLIASIRSYKKLLFIYTHISYKCYVLINFISKNPGYIQACSRKRYSSAHTAGRLAIYHRVSFFMKYIIIIVGFHNENTISHKGVCITKALRTCICVISNWQKQIIKSLVRFFFKIV